MADVPAGLSRPLAKEYRAASSSSSFRPAAVASSDRSSISLSARDFFEVIGHPIEKARVVQDTDPGARGKVAGQRLFFPAFVVSALAFPGPVNLPFVNGVARKEGP